MMTPKAALIALPLALVALAGCGSSSKSSSTTTSTPTATKTTAQAAAPATSATSAKGTIMVSMKGLAFVPATLHAKVGQTVMWMNDDTPQHTVTYESGPKFVSSGDINPGGMYSIKLTKAGTIHYICTIHPFMHGTIIVTG